MKVMFKCKLKAICASYMVYSAYYLSYACDTLRLLTHIGISVQVQSFSVAITFSSFFVFIFKST